MRETLWGGEMSERICLKCTSITYANKGQHMLARAGIRGSVQRDKEKGRCSYCINIDARDRARALLILREGGVRVLP